MRPKVRTPGAHLLMVTRSATLSRAPVMFSPLHTRYILAASQGKAGLVLELLINGL